MPPCAYSVLLSEGSALVRMTTAPADESSTAALRPATPLPTIMKSPRTSTGRILAHRSRPIIHGQSRRRRGSSPLSHLHRIRTDRESGADPRRIAAARVATLFHLESCRL